MVRHACIAIAGGLALLLCCLASAQNYRTDDGTQKLAQDQLSQNRAWEREAIRQEQNLVTQGNQAYARKDFARAAQLYRAALDITYDQWIVKKSTYAGVDTYTPAGARDRARVKLDTANTRTARDRLATMDQAIAAETLDQVRKKLNQAIKDADTALKEGDCVKAYTPLREALDSANRLANKGDLADLIKKSQDKLQDIIAVAGKPLDEVDKLLSANNAAEANAKLDAFAKASAAVLAAIPEVKSRYDKLAGKPEIRSDDREQEVKKRIAQGDAALQKEDYLRAARAYREGATIHPDSPSARTAAEKLAAMQNDPAIVEKLKQQEVDALAQPLIAQAEIQAAMKQYDEARINCQRVIDQYGTSTLVPKAKELLQTIARESAAAAKP